MTNTPDYSEQAAGLYAAAAHLENLKETLRAAGSEQVDPIQLHAALREYWRADGYAIRQAGVAVLETVRLQAISRLYQWRAQVAEQVSSRDPAPGHTVINDHESDCP